MSRIIKADVIFEESLSPCPFCGNTPGELDEDGKYRMFPVVLNKYLEEPSFYGIKEEPRTRYFVNCKQCGATGGSGIAYYNALTKITTTKEEAKEIAIEKWNNRREV